MAKSPEISTQDEVEIIDEFTVPGEQKVQLVDSQPRIQSLFPVQFKVLPPLDSFPQEHEQDSKVPERIWVELKGKKEDVCKAKEYIKGSSEPEIEVQESYPKEMHCIFAGAFSIFLDHLTRDTCATITVLEIGLLGIKGRRESFAMAQSKVQHLVKIFTDNGSLSPRKEPQVKRDFKVFVEGHADKYTMDLLLLPSTLKEELLILTGNDQFPSAQDDCDVEVTIANSQDGNHSKEEEAGTNRHTPVAELMCLLDSVLPGDNSKPTSSSAQQQERLKSKRRGSEKESACRKKPFSLEEIQTDGMGPKSPNSSSIPIIDLISSDKEEPEVIDLEEPMSKEMEYKILVNFFKSMGYHQDVVEEVIVNLGQTQETIKIFEEINKRSDPSPASSNSQKETPEGSRGLEVSCMSKTVAPPKPEVNMARDMIPGPSEKRPLPELSLKTPSQESTSERVEYEKNMLSYGFVARGASSPPTAKRVLSSGNSQPSNQPDVIFIKKIPITSNHENNLVFPSSSAGKSTPLGSQAGFRPTLMYPAVPSSSAEKQTALGNQACPQPPVERHMPLWNQACPELAVTGVQRFLNSIKMPYKLELKNEPGKEDLKHIIIDGSNVAMSHGLRHYFSCRGIAIAVEYFWRNGHRKITVFVPQWRTKKDPRTTEQHFLQQLEELGLLSFTPARTVLGSHIASHDDRFLLHLAEQTGGIIVTNDNLREFVLESPAWKQIIKDRLLPYTFVGDLFMPPDDPLGRYGPKLQEFLSTRYQPVTPPTDSGVLFPSQNAFASRVPIIPVLPRFNPLIKPTIMNTARPQAAAPPKRSYNETISLRDSLLQIFPETEQREKINQILSDHPYMRDLNALSAMILD